MAKVTYLLGAGASFNCLPTYANFSDRFRLFRDFIEGSKNGLGPDDRIQADNLMSLCYQLQDEFTFHNTPDTVAKKYFHSRNISGDKLNKLKILLTLYFIYEQCLGSTAIQNGIYKGKGKAPIEKRYDSFIAAILEPIYGEIKIDSNFNILTWNYDLQFEICFNNYLGKGFHTAQKEVQSIPAPETIKSDFKFDVKKFSIVHLNGVAYSEKSEKYADYKVPFGTFINDNSILLKNLIDHYQTMITNEENIGNKYLNFAWERHDSFPHPKDILDLTFKYANAIAEKTEVLVIIGYSFPIFNRAVDIEIFRNMKKLRQIYIQSPNAATLKKAIIDIFHPVNNIVNEKNVDPIENLDYFHIPHEANLEFKPKYSFTGI